MRAVGDGWMETACASENGQAAIFEKNKEMETQDVDGVLSHPS